MDGKIDIFNFSITQHYSIVKTMAERQIQAYLETVEVTRELVDLVEKFRPNTFGNYTVEPAKALLMAVEDIRVPIRGILAHIPAQDRYTVLNSVKESCPEALKILCAVESYTLKMEVHRLNIRLGGWNKNWPWNWEVARQVELLEHLKLVYICCLN